MKFSLSLFLFLICLWPSQSFAYLSCDTGDEGWTTSTNCTQTLGTDPDGKTIYHMVVTVTMSKPGCMDVVNVTRSTAYSGCARVVDPKLKNQAVKKRVELPL